MVVVANLVSDGLDFGDDFVGDCGVGVVWRKCDRQLCFGVGVGGDRGNVFFGGIRSIVA